MPSVVRISQTGHMFYRDYTCITIVPGTRFTKTICSAPAHLQHGAHSYRLISTDHRALSSKPAGRRYLRDRRTDTRPLHRPRLACAHTEELWDSRCQMLHMLLNFCKQELPKTDMTVVESEKYILILSNVANNVFRLICQAICGENE